MREWGLAQGEFTETGGWPHQLYIREGRRMIGDYVMTEHHCRGEAGGGGLGRAGAATHGLAQLPAGRADGQGRQDDRAERGGRAGRRVRGRTRSRTASIVPKEAECANLLVPVCLSSTHIAYGSIRMEPVFMVLGQIAGDGGCDGDRREHPRAEGAVSAAKAAACGGQADAGVDGAGADCGRAADGATNRSWRGISRAWSWMPSRRS